VAQHKLDRRVQRTHQLLHQALVELIMEKSYDQITVQDILDRANIGRATFYAHFTDKDALLLEGIDEDHFDIRQYLSEAESAADEGKLLPCYSLFRHAQQFHSLYKALLGSQGIEIVKTAFRKHLVYMVERRLKQHIPAFPLPFPVVSQYLAGALMALMMWWLDHDMPYSPQDMDTMVQQIAMTGLERLINEQP
jgi:AcrR family transcriptional regulator